MKTKMNAVLGASLALIMIVVLSSLKQASLTTKELAGAWEYNTVANRTVMIGSETAFAVATYDQEGRKFIGSYGGGWHMDGDKLVQTIEWNTAVPDEVGTTIKLDAKIVNGKLLIQAKNETWKRTDDGQPGELAGAWIITGNYQNDSLKSFPNIFKSRRTMKILSGTRFQWIAYGIDSKKFLNSGGGTYTTDNGKYTEHIEFFTKSPDGVGKSLTFNYAFDNGHWRHSGLSSTGSPVDERWTKRETLEKQ